MSNWFKLDHLASLLIVGDDAKTFAQAQFTSDMANTPENHWFPTAWCDPKGRVLSVMLAKCREGVVELICPASQIDLLLHRLPMFAIGRKVQVSAGDGVCGCLDHDQSDGALAFDPGRGLRLMSEGTGAGLGQLQQWRHADLEAGIPWLSPETSAEHLPQALGLEALDAISYSKGCYPGQEVIARVHYLGKVKHRTTRVAFEGEDPLPSGTLLIDEQDKRLGQLLWSVAGKGESSGLAVVYAGAKAGLGFTAKTEDRAVPGQVSL